MNINWPTKKLGEIAQLRMGETLIKKDLTGDGLPVYSADSLDKPWGFTSKSKLKFSRGSIVVGARGTIGSIKLPEDKEFVSTQTTIIISPYLEIILSEFLYYYLATINFKKITAGSGIPMLTIGHLKRIKIPLPPLPIQQKIVERLDAIRKAQELNNKQIALADEFFQSLLHRELDPKGKNWKLLKLGNFVEKIEYGLSVSVQDCLSDDGIPILTMNEIENDGEINYQKARRISVSQEEFKKFKVSKGELLFNWRNEKRLIGKTGLFNSEKDFIFASFLLRIIPNEKILPEFLWYWLNYLRTKKVYLRYAHLAGNQASYNATSLRNKISCPLVPLETQKKIIEKLSAFQE